MHAIRTAAVILPLIGSAASAQLITFEPDDTGRLPDGTLAADDLDITTQYEAAFGVRFGIDADGDLVADAGKAPKLEQGGSDGNDGFLNDTTGVNDQARPGFEDRLGDWHLRTSQGLFGNPADVALLIQYTSGNVDAASGEIWDIDGNDFLGTEQYLVTAYDDTGTELDSILSPLGTTIDDAANEFQAAPWQWAFDFRGTDARIDTIRISFVGSKSTLIGLAFDNFNVSEVPGPGGSVALMVAGTLFAVRRPRGLIRSRADRA